MGNDNIINILLWNFIRPYFLNNAISVGIVKFNIHT